MEIDPAVVVIGSACVAAALLYFVPRIFTRGAKTIAESGASPIQVEEQVKSVSGASDDPAPPPPVEQTQQAIYETVQPETAPPPPVSSSPAVIPFGAKTQTEHQKPYRRRSNYSRTRSASRTSHPRKHKQE
jgi:type IV secretory pathway VirB10-like protein